jgi:glycosyltransferase involved in cell wall biosynthesis
MENGVCNLANGLRSRGFESIAGCLERRGTFCKRFGESYVYLLGKRNGFSVRAVWNLFHLVRRVRPSILHTHNLGPLIYASISTFGGRYCKIVHGEHAQLAPWELTERRLRQRKRLYKGCSAIHTVSQTQVAELSAISGAPIISIPNGVDTDRFSVRPKEVAKRLAHLPLDSIVIGMVGRFGPFKGHSALLSAFREISPHFPNAKLILVGGGGSEESKIRVQMNGIENVSMVGFRDDPETFYRAMDLLVVPSTNEGMSNAALEAMACGVPVLGNIGCGHEEIISSGEDGVVADLRRPDLIANEIIKIIRSTELLSELGKKARMKIESRFSIHSMLDAYEQLYRAHAR